MAGHEPPATERSFRESVEFYLLDHRTPLGKAIDVGLLALNLAFIAIVVVETYRLSPSGQAWLWRAEVAIAGVFLVEYVLRLYGAPDRLAEVRDPYAVVDLVSILPTFTVLLLPGVTPDAAVRGTAPRAGGPGAALFPVHPGRGVLLRPGLGGPAPGDEAALDGPVHLLRLRRVLLRVRARREPGHRRLRRRVLLRGVSLTTVGFGDIAPVTDAGRWVTVGAILVAVVVLPWELRKVVRQWTRSEKVDVTCPNCGLRFHDPDASHCKACGAVIYQELLTLVSGPTLPI